MSTKKPSMKFLQNKIEKETMKNIETLETTLELVKQ